MELKILFITVLFLGASAAFSLREEQEDALNEYEAQELEEMNNDGPEYDLEDPAKGPWPSCPKGYVLKCFSVTYCYRYLRLCRCIRYKTKYGDETEFDNQLNDEMLETLEDEAENFNETIEELEDPSKKVLKPKPSPKCRKNLTRKCFLVKYGKSKRVVCTCVPRCPYKG